MATRIKGGLFFDKDEIAFIEEMLDACWNDECKTSHRDVVTALETLITLAEELDDD